jgi:hypothetical protein
LIFAVVLANLAMIGADAATNPDEAAFDRILKDVSSLRGIA